MLSRFLVALMMVCLGALPAAAQDKLLVFAAASLTEAMTEVGEAYAKTGRPAPAFSFAGSSALARQIENGAPAGVFISADEEWMDYLAARKLIAADTRVSFLGNTLVLIVPKGETLGVTIAPNFALAAALKGRKIALADPNAVPAGRYGRAALEHLGVWAAVAPSVVRADNVRAALTFVERKEAAAGIVYGTDASLTDKVAVAGTFPADSHTPISYPVALIAAHDTAEARAFRDFLLRDEAKAIYRKFGFAVP